MEFSRYIVKAREKLFKFPKTFYNHAELSCGYLLYLRIERGEKLPSGDLALEILKALECDIKLGIYAWARDQFSSDEAKAMFKPSLHQLKRSKKIGEKAALAVNRMQASLLRKAPIYWEILTYINAYSHMFHPDAKKIAEECHITFLDAEKYLAEMYEYGLLDRGEDGGFATREWLFIPYDDEYKDLRDRNFQTAYVRFWQQSGDWKFRTTHTRTVTSEQKEVLQQKILTLLDEITEMPDEQNAKAMTLGIFAGDRSFEQP